MPTYDRTYEYRADFNGHEFAGTVIASNISAALDAIGFQADRHEADTVDIRFVAEVKRTTCCQRGDWSGASHQPASAYIYVPISYRFPVPSTYFSPETTDDYRWECEYCGRVGTRAELEGKAPTYTVTDTETGDIVFTTENEREARTWVERHNAKSYDNGAEDPAFTYQKG